MNSTRSNRLFRISAPYRQLEELSQAAISVRPGTRGEALVWQLCLPIEAEFVEVTRCRPPGIGLLLVLPSHRAEDRLSETLSVVSTIRPTHVLPHVQTACALFDIPHSIWLRRSQRTCYGEAFTSIPAWTKSFERLLTCATN